MMRETDLHQVLDLAEHVAAELAAEALNLTAHLTWAERRGLLALALAIEAEAARTVGIEPRTEEAEAVLMRAVLATVLP